MAKKVDPLKAKQAKQKKIAIGLSILFAAVLAYQVPKTLKMLKRPSAATASAPVPVPVPASTTPGVAAPASGAPLAAAAAPGASQPAVLIDSDQPIAAGEGQLLSFELFQAHDPFVQQADPAAVGAAPAGDAAGDGGTLKTVPAASLPRAKTGGSIVPATGTGSSETGMTPTPGQGASTAPPVAPAATTTIALNGEQVVFAADGSFPADEPTFLLVSTASDGASVEIGIAGGTYADGEETITLKLGKPLTLQNTADGSRYELELLTVAGFAPPKPKK